MAESRPAALQKVRGRSLAGRSCSSLHSPIFGLLRLASHVREPPRDGREIFSQPLSDIGRRPRAAGFMATRPAQRNRQNSGNTGNGTEPMNTETSNTHPARSAWETVTTAIVIASIGIGMLAAAVYRADPFLSSLSSVFLALSVIVGATAFVLAARERSRLPAFVSAVASMAIAILLIREWWRPDVLPWLDATAAALAVAAILGLAALLLWYRLAPPPERPDWHLADAPPPLSGRDAFIGRLEELRALDAAWDEAAAPPLGPRPDPDQHPDRRHHRPGRLRQDHPGPLLAVVAFREKGALPVIPAPPLVVIPAGNAGTQRQGWQQTTSVQGRQGYLPPRPLLARPPGGPGREWPHRGPLSPSRPSSHQLCEPSAFLSRKAPR
nr:MAG: hypothetical protein BECKH772A_GA0070896_1001822 [Candidatus Kentron sp. H]VFJ90930.1 MAG: hypothetical protein BECKH772B_GA0070898_1001226 [Candidatus Kentron sp. H]